jgi:hypothetical protein
MSHLRRFVLAVPAALAIALCGAPTAGAHMPSQDGGRIVTPDHTFGGLSGGEVMGQSWVRVYSLPEAENPFFGNGEQCVRLGRKGKVLKIYGPECTVPQGTAVLINGFSGACSDAEPPPGFAIGKAAQRRCAEGTIRPLIKSIHLTLDGGEPVDIHRRRYEIFSPQMKLQVPEDHPFATPGAHTLTAWGWEAWVTKLRPGRHTIRTEVTFTDDPEPSIDTAVIHVLRRYHHGDG